MTWRLAVEHVTGYDYTGDVLASYNEARLTPSRDFGQFVLEHRIDVRPAVPLFRYVDYWGSEVCAFDVQQPHRRLAVSGRSVVETSGAQPLMVPAGWDDLARDDTRDRFDEFLTPSSYVPGNDSRIATAAADLLPGRSPAAAVDAACAWTRDQLVYESGATDVSTTATGALDLGRGVCQDFVHVALALLRAMGIPARYASGYLHPNADALIGETVTGQSHAWLEAWIGAWHAVDPTNGTEVAHRHVLVARGRDYGDVPPLKGVFHGSPGLTIDVRVAISRLA